MDESGAMIRTALESVKAFLAQESPPRLSEADTKAYFVEPIVKALGWEGIGAVTREYYVRNSQEFIDYALKAPDGRPLVAIETKALQTVLTDKHAAQLVQYCAVEGIEWAALTNGRELEFFNVYLKGDLAAKRLLRLDMLAFNSDADFDAIQAQLSQLSFSSMTTATGVRTWMHQRRMETVIRRQLTTPGSAALTALAKALAADDIPVSSHDLVRWFQRHLGVGEVHPKTPAEPITAQPTGQDISPPIPTPKSVRLAQDVGKLLPLVESGLLPVGTSLVLMKGTQVILRAAVDARGRIATGEAAYRSPSDRVFAQMLGRQSLNGWTGWRAELPDGSLVLDVLRQRLDLASDSA